MVLARMMLVLLWTSVSESKKPNIILIVTDDQDTRLGGMEPMNHTRRLVGGEGVTFRNAYTTSPICCPSRASILTGLYPHNHHVTNNSAEGNCYGQEWKEGLEKNTVAVTMKEAGYTTFYAGKYLNQYGMTDDDAPMPAGWDSWVGLIGNSKYYDYKVSINGTVRSFQRKYLTTLLKRKSLEYLRSMQKRTEPFFMMICPPAPHYPFTPEPKYSGVFKGITVPRNDYYNYANNSEKHWIVRMQPSPLPKDALNLLDQYHASRWESLLSVDNLVISIWRHLKRNNILNDTYIIFTSDNGFHLGQFSLEWDKRQPYEFDINVPLLIAGPGLPKNVVLDYPVLLMDLAPTLAYLAGQYLPDLYDGKSFLPITHQRRRTFLIEYTGEGGVSVDPECLLDDQNLYGCIKEALCRCQDARNNTYSCVREISNTHNYLYCNFYDDEGFQEFYDLEEDPYQLYNKINYKNEELFERYHGNMKKLKDCKGLSCHV